MELMATSSADSLSLNPFCGTDAIRDDIRIPRPPNAFMIFGKEYRKVLANKFQDLSNKQISKILGDEWKKMDSELKTHYHCLADETHRLHLIKYPGYYYSPLEARQRKAERKRKSKMSKSSHKSKSLQTDCPVVQTFGGNRPFGLQSAMHPMMRPSFGTPIPPRMICQPMVRYGPNQPFGGFVRFPRMGFGLQPRHAFIVPINVEHNYAAPQTADPMVPQTDNNFEIKVENEVEVEVEVKSESKDMDECETEPKVMTETHDMELLYSFMPPMLNPNIEVTQVVDTEGQSPQVSDNTIESEAEVTKMSNASIDCEEILSQNIKQEIIDELDDQSCNTGVKVVVQSVNQ